MTPWAVACQASLSVKFSRQEHWSGLPCPSRGDLPNPGIKLGSPELQADSLLSETPGKPEVIRTKTPIKLEKAENWKCTSGRWHNPGMSSSVRQDWGWRSQLQQGPRGTAVYNHGPQTACITAPWDVYENAVSGNTYGLAESKLLIYIFFCILPDSSFAHRIHNFLFRVARQDRKTVRRDVSDHFLM